MLDESYESLSVGKKKKFDIKYLIYYIMFEFIEAFSTSFFAIIFGYSSEGTNNPSYLLTIIWFLAKVLPLVIVIVIFKNRLSSLFKDTVKTFKKFLLYTFICYFIFYLFEVGETYFIRLLGGQESENQTSIYSLFGSSTSIVNYILLFIVIVILAPLLEEIEYREIIFKMFDGCHFLVPVFISSSLFSFAHVLDVTSLEAFIDGLKFFPVYFLPGFALALIYHYSNNNFYSTFLIHAVANGISFYAIIVEITTEAAPTSI